MVQSLFEQNLDVYTRRARLGPALIAILPVVLTVLAFFPNEFTLLGMLVSILVCCSGTALLAQIGRDMGKQKEEKLFGLWKGKPTTQLLRYSNTKNTKVLAQRHSKLQSLLPSLQMPTAQEEASNPEHVDEIYEAWAAHLRTKTRDRDKFPLVFEENCNYGFRRNLWGMKPIGITVSLLGVVAIGVLIGINFFNKSQISTPVAIYGLANTFLLLFWLFVFTPSWVKIPADAYAERLLEACENL